MAQQNKKKRGWQWLLWTGFIILLLVVGLGPLAMLISFTRFENSGFENFWDRFRGGNDYEHQVELPSEEPQHLEPYMVQYIYRYCDHSYVFMPNHLPSEFEQPPTVLAELVAALHYSNLTIENIMDELKNPGGWYLAHMKENGQPVFMLTYLDDFCPDCAESYYLGIFDKRIAVYQGCPPRGKLLDVTEYMVKEIDRNDLEGGVVFESEEQKRMLLEAYTS